MAHAEAAEGDKFSDTKLYPRIDSYEAGFLKVTVVDTTLQLPLCP
jgi:hypothetical protein